MKPPIRASLLVAAGAAGFLFLLAGPGRADITNPGAPFTPVQVQPKSPDTAITAPKMPRAATPATVSSPLPSAQPAPSPAPDSAAVVAPEPVASVVPVPSGAPVIAPAPAARPRALRVGRAADGMAAEAAVAPVRTEPFQQTIDPVNSGLRTIGAFLAEMASACKVGVGSGSGGPVLVFAVLGMAAALERRWVRRARWAIDEDLPELLYAGVVIAPG